MKMLTKYPVGNFRATQGETCSNIWLPWTWFRSKILSRTLLNFLYHLSSFIYFTKTLRTFHLFFSLCTFHFPRLFAGLGKVLKCSVLGSVWTKVLISFKQRHKWNILRVEDNADAYRRLMRWLLSSPTADSPTFCCFPAGQERDTHSISFYLSFGHKNCQPRKLFSPFGMSGTLRDWPTRAEEIEIGV